MKKRLLIMLAILVISLFVVTGLAAEGQQEGTDADKVYKMRFSISLPDYHYMAKPFTDWAALVEKNSKGKMDVEVYYAAQLYKDKQCLEAIQTGAIEGGLIYTHIIATVLPEFEVFNLPMLFYSVAEELKVADSDIGKKIFAKVEDKNIKIAAAFPWPMEDLGILTPKPVKVPSDLKGLTIRGTGVVTGNWLGKLGASSAYISGAEVYMALQRGTLDGSMGQISGLITRKQYEVAPYFIVIPLSGMFAMPGLNLKYFNSLPAELQKAILDAGAEVQAGMPAYSVEQVGKLEAQAPGLGAAIFKPNEEEKKLWAAGIKDVWLESLSKKPEAIALIDPILELLGKSADF